MHGDDVGASGSVSHFEAPASGCQGFRFLTWLWLTVLVLQTDRAKVMMSSLAMPFVLLTKQQLLGQGLMFL